MLESHMFLNDIEKKGWRASILNDGWELRRKAEERPVFLSITPHWLCLSSPLSLADKREHWYANLSEQVRFYNQLLQQNEQMSLIKLSLDNEGRPVAMAEIPDTDNSPLYLDQALETLAYYCSTDLLTRKYKTKENGLGRWKSGEISASIPQEKLNQYIRGIQNDKWKLTLEARNRTWRLVYLGQVRTFTVYLTVTRHWTYFQIPLLIGATASVLRADLEPCRLFQEYLLSLNRSWFMAKAGLDREGVLLLLLEFPTEVLDFSLFQFAIQTLAVYLDRYGQEINIMAMLEHDKQLVELLSKHK